MASGSGPHGGTNGSCPRATDSRAVACDPSLRMVGNRRGGGGGTSQQCGVMVACRKRGWPYEYLHRFLYQLTEKEVIDEVKQERLKHELAHRDRQHRGRAAENQGPRMPMIEQ